MLENFVSLDLKLSELIAGLDTLVVRGLVLVAPRRPGGDEE